MKILVLSSVYARNPQDVEVPWMRESLKRLKTLGIDVSILAPSWKGLKDHQIDGISVQRFRYGPASWEILTHDEGAPSKMASKPWMQLLAIPYIISGSVRCWLYCRKNRPDLIHAHWPFPHGLIALWASWCFSIPVLLNFHGAELLLMRKHPWVKTVLHFLLGQCKKVFSNSSFTKAKIQAIRAVPVEISPYGSTIQQQGLAPRPCGPNDRFVVLFVGRHIERKGLNILIQAAAQLSQEHFEVRIVGHGDLTRSLQDQVNALQLSHVIFVGKLSTEELRKEYQKAHCFVLPAIVDSKGDTEGLGVVLIEAAESGLALVASDVGGIPDVVIHQKTGLLVPEKNPDQLAQALQLMAQNQELRFELVRGAQAHIRQEFDWDRIVQKQLASYTSTIKN